jgi:lysophospholipase L1-like esterase
VAKKGGGGGCLLVVAVLAVLGFAYYKWQEGSSAAPPPGPTTGGGSGRYVALGDSYTSAPDVGAAAGGPPGCARSNDNYPHVVSSNLLPKEFVDVSCSGATTANLTSAQVTKNGTNPPQLDAVTQATTLVTIGIGGNDVGFIQLAQQCVTASPHGSACHDRLTAGGHDQLADRVDAVGTRLGDALDTIHGKAPKARIVVVGYPTVLPDGDGCWPTLPVGSVDVGYLRDTLAKLNSKLSDVARSHNAGYADTASSSKGHDLCTASGTRWVEGVVPTSPAAPLHPNAKGEQEMAADVLPLVK